MWLVEVPACLAKGNHALLPLEFGRCGCCAVSPVVVQVFSSILSLVLS